MVEGEYIYIQIFENSFRVPFEKKDTKMKASILVKYLGGMKATLFWLRASNTLMMVRASPLDALKV